MLFSSVPYCELRSATLSGCQLFHLKVITLTYPCSQEFQDALALRYWKPLLSLPSFCDGCSAPFSVEHALYCCVGGLVGQRHNEVWDAIGDLVALVWGQVQWESVVCGSTLADCNSDTLIADLRIRGVW